jgi:hypothetical protein
MQPLLDYQTSRFLHRHGDSWEQMHERDVDAASLDPERHWARGTKLYECPCGDQFIVGPEHDPDDAAGKIEPHR